MNGGFILRILFPLLYEQHIVFFSSTFMADHIAVKVGLYPWLVVVLLPRQLEPVLVLSDCCFCGVSSPILCSTALDGN